MIICSLNLLLENKHKENEEKLRMSSRPPQAGKQGTMHVLAIAASTTAKILSR
jgi:hypothetical protein